MTSATYQTAVSRVLAFLMVAATAIGACSAAPVTNQATPTASTVAATAQPKKGGVLRVLLRVDAPNLDLAKDIGGSGYMYADQLYDPLVTANEANEILPGGVAESWTISPDNLTYTFKLRQNVKFHSGRAMTSEDVKYTIDRIRNPATASPRRANFAAVSSIDVSDPYTVVFRLSQPFAPLLANLASFQSGIVDRDVAEKPGGLNAAEGGTGPFVLTEWVKDTRVVLTRNPNYWRAGYPLLDGITVTFNADDNARAAAIRSGAVDFLYKADAAFIDALKQDSNLLVSGGRSKSFSVFNMNLTKKPFDDVRVRQAIFYAINREEVRDTANSGFGAVLNGGFQPDGQWAAIQSIYGKPDIAKSKALLAEAGYASGFNATCDVISTSAFHVRGIQTVQQQLKAVGIQIEIRPLESGRYQQSGSSGDFQCQYGGSGIGAGVDLDERFSQQFITGAGANYAKFSDRELDDLVQKGRTTTGRNEREKFYQDAQRILATRGPMAFTYAFADFDVVVKKVKGYVFDITPTYRSFQETWLDQ